MKPKGFVLPVPLIVLAVLIAGGAALVFYSGDSGNREDAQNTLKQELSSGDTEAPAAEIVATESRLPAPSPPSAPKENTTPTPSPAPLPDSGSAAVPPPKPKSSTQPVKTEYSYSTPGPGWEILTKEEKAQLP